MENNTSVTILVIDADASSRSYLAAVLQKGNYSVLVTSSGREGLIAAWQNIPSLIVVDPVLADIAGAELVARLRKDKRTCSIPCIALSSGKNDDVNAFLAAGFNDYLKKSTQAVSQLLGMIPRYLQRTNPAAEKNGLMIVFLSAKGGTGTSSLCANIAMCLGKNRPDAQVMVADLVLPIGSIAQIVGYESKLNLVSVTELPPEQTTASFFKENLSSIAQWNFRLLAGSPDPGSANQLQVGRISEILNAIREFSDFVFVDLGRSLSRISMPIIMGADIICIVLSTDLSSVTLTKTVWEHLRMQGVDKNRIFPILNRAVGLEGLTKNEAEQMLGLQIRMTMPYLGGNFTLANNRHEPLVSKFANDSAAIMLNQATEQIANLCKQLREGDAWRKT